MQSIVIPGLAGQSQFRAPFPVVQASDITVTVDGITAAFTLADNTVTLTTPLAVAGTVKIVQARDYYRPSPVGNADQLALNATIANGANLSGAVDLGTARLVALATPAALDGTSLTFQTSTDNSTWSNLYDEYGTEKSVVVAASRRVLLNPADFFGAQFIKVRTGTAASPVAQTGAREIKLIAAQ